MKSSARYNRSRMPNMRTKTITSLGGGINEVFSPMNLDDSCIYKCRNFYSTDGVTLKTTPCTPYADPFPLSAGESARFFATWNGVGSGVLPLMMNTADATTWNAAVIQGATGTVYDVSSHNFQLDAVYRKHGAFEYITQAEKYSIYWSQYENFFLVQAQSTHTVTTVTLPTNVYPVCMISHNTRIVLLDTHNTLWWSNAGDYTTWYGETPDGVYQADDAGYWFVDAGTTLNQIISFADSVYIFGDNAIYRLYGSDDTNYQLVKLFTGLGTYPYYERSLVATKNLLYFVYDDKVYEFDGTSYPRLISEPVVVGDTYSNGIKSAINSKWWASGSGITGSDWVFRALVVYGDFLYLYSQSTTRYQNGVTYGYAFIPTYKFDIRRRSWWMGDAFYAETTGYASVSSKRTTIIPAVGTDGVLTWAVNMHFNTSSASTKGSRVMVTGYDIVTSAGTITSGNYYTQTYYAWMTTKAFETSLDGKFKISEVNITWRYADTQGDRRLYQQLSWSPIASDSSGIATPFLADYVDSGILFPEYGSFLTLCDGDWKSSWIDSDFEHSTVNVSRDDWQDFPVTTSWKCYPGRTYISQAPYFRLSLLVQYAPIEILRIELKYRALTATR